MEVITQVGQWMANSFISIWNALGTWGVIGFTIIAIPLLRKVTNLLKQILQF